MRWAVPLAVQFPALILAQASFVEPQPRPRYTPITMTERWERYVKRAYGPEAWVRGAFVAGLKQWRDEPPQWRQGMAGFGRRYGSSMGRHAVRNSIEFGFGALIGEDPRYEQCQCRGFLPRVAHAAASTFVARNGSGERKPAIARLTGIYGGSILSVRWHPQGYTVAGDGLRWGTLSLGFNAGFNVLREYWPDIKRALGR
jgi:hypothetical protein